MNKKDKYKLVFKLAQEFVDNIVLNHPELNKKILTDHLKSESKFDNIKDAQRRLIESLSNRNMMFSVIGFSKREKEMNSILFGYKANKILSTYKDPNELLKVFRKKFNLKNTVSKRSLWRKFAEGIISGSQFMSSFKDKKDFDQFIQKFSLNKYTKAALPMLLSKEIDGFGFALACDFLKELGYRDYPKPDVHLIEIFYQLGLSDTKEPYDVYKSIIEMVEIVNKDAYTVDKIFWLIGSGRFYLVNIEVGRNRDKFIKETKKKI